jgi:crotonobetainyl-CoA:carnitine CoA-transferase CaiB-like acyl-CoA transferase
MDDPQFRHRFQWISKEILDADMLPYPVKFTDCEPPVPTRAPDVGQHTDAVLTELAGYDAAKVKALRDAGVVF